MGNIAWIVLLLAAFVTGFFVGKRHGQKLERAAKEIKQTVDSL